MLFDETENRYPKSRIWVPLSLYPGTFSTANWHPSSRFLVPLLAYLVVTKVFNDDKDSKSLKQNKLLFVWITLRFFWFRHETAGELTGFQKMNLFMVV